MGNPEPVRGKSRIVLRVTVIGGVGLLLATGILLYLNFFLWLPVGSGPVGISVSSQSYQSPWTDRPVVLLGAGDSITAGFGAEDGNAFFARLANNPSNEFADMRGLCLHALFPKLTVSNRAINGSTSIDCVQEQLPRIKPYNNDVFGVIVLTTGGNDLIHMYGRIPPREGAMYGATLEQARPWITNFDERLRMIIASLKSAFPGGCCIFLGNIYDPSDNTGNTQAAGLPPWPDMLRVLEAYNACLERIADQDSEVELVDIHGAFLGHGMTCRQFWQPHYQPHDPHYWYYDNLEDPNDRGHDAIRRLFLNKIVGTLSSRLKSADKP